MILLFLPTQLGKHFWPPFSYVLGVRVDYLAPTLFFTDVLLIILFLSILLKKVEDKSIRRFVLSIVTYVWQSLFLLTGLVSLFFGTVVSKNPLISILVELRFLEMLIFGWYTLAFLRQERNRQMLLVVFSAAIIFESFLAIAQFSFQHSLGSIFYLLGERAITASTPGAANASFGGTLLLRPYATFSHPNVLAGYLLVGGSIVYCFITQLPRKTRMQKLIAYLAFLSISAAILLSFSRITIILFFTSCIFFTFLFSRMRRKILPVVVGLLIPLALLFPLLFERFTAPDFFGESFSDRLFLTTASFRMLVAHPIFGVGLGQFLSTLPSFFPSLPYSRLQPVHNIYLLFATETGLVGFLSFLLFFVQFLKKRIAKKNNILFFTPLLLSILVGMTDHYLLTQQQGRLLFALSLSLAFYNPHMFAHPLRKNTQKS